MVFTMTNRKLFELWYQKLHKQCIDSSHYQKLIDGSFKKQDLENIIKNICKSHLRSPQILAFLYSIVPPSATYHMKENLLEELGVDDDQSSHPDLLLLLCKSSGLDGENIRKIQNEADQVLKNKITEPLMFGSLKEVGLNVMLEVIGFEWFLSREASNLGNALKKGLSLTQESLIWFYHHSEVDIAHAEEGLDALVEYVTYYDLDAETVEIIGEITFRENIFLKRYFDLQVESGI